MAENDDLGQIIKGCKAGQADSFSQFIDIYAERCYGFFYRLTGDREVSDELLAELFARLVTKITSYKGGSFESWLFRIAANIFHDYLRAKQKQKRVLEVRKKQLAAELVQSRQSDSRQIDRLQIQLEKLDADTREVIMLRFYGQLSFKEMAKLRAEPIGTTLAKVHRGLKKLRNLMEQ